MNLVYIENGRPVTDSLTVAEVFGKSHDNVMRDIRNQIEKLHDAEEKDFSLLNFEESTYSNERGRTYQRFLLTEEGFAIVTMAYVTTEAMKFKVRFINEFNRMKQQLASPTPSYMIDDPIRRAEKWIEEERQRQALEALNKQREEQLTLQAPKVALYDTAMSAHNNFTMERVSKTLGYGRNKLFQFLREKKVLRSNNLPYQEYLDRGYFDVRQYSVTHFTNGIENKTQTLVTPKGMAYIHKLLIEHGKSPA